MSEATGERGRAELLELVICAVEAAQGEAKVGGGREDYVKLCDEVLFPFLEDELERASRICSVGSNTTHPCTRIAMVMVGEEGSEPTTCLYHAVRMELRHYNDEIIHALKEAEYVCGDVIKDLFDKGTHSHWELL